MFFLISCSTKTSYEKFNFFDTNISFDEFKEKLDEYAKNNPYPNINNQMNNVKNIAIVGLGQIGIYLYNEINLKKKKLN